MNLGKNKEMLTLIVLILFALIVPLFITNKLTVHIMVLILIYASISGAWNILAGYGGQLSLGHATFFGVGAYTSTLLFLNFGMSPWLSLIVVIFFSLLLGVFIGLPTFRLKGPFFTLATIAFSQVALLLANFWRELTKGAVGISIPYQPSLKNMMFSNNYAYYYLTLGLLVIVVGITYLVDRSKIGSYLIAIREDEDGAEALGINVNRYKMYAMLISSGLSGVTGVIYAQYILYIDPSSLFNLNFSVQVALMSIIGGMGTILGPVFGAILIVPLNEYLRSAFPGINGISYFIYGVVLMLVVTLIPNGILPTINKKLKSWAIIRKTKKGEKYIDSSN